MNKKGFTIVELLAVILILGLIAAIAVAAVSNILGMTEEEYYETQEDLIILAAREYYVNYPALLPKIDGATETLDDEDLIKGDYIEEIKDHTGALCTKVSITVTYNEARDEYTYAVNWQCPNYTS